jgi:hypothetical protein
MNPGIRTMSIVENISRRLWRRLMSKRAPEDFLGSGIYWEQRYARRGNSGVGSYGKFAAFKAEILNTFVVDNDVRAVIEFGCGDGNQLLLSQYPNYLGFDISETAIRRCEELFAHDRAKSFELAARYSGQKADLVLSLDVIYHLVEDQVFEAYMQLLFAASERYVIIYSSDTDDNQGYESMHVRHRKFSRWIERNAGNWNLLELIPNRYPYIGDYTEGSFSDFHVYGKSDA